MRTLLATLLLTGCTSALPPSAEPAPADAIADVRTAWDAEPSLPTSQTAKCDRDLSTMRVAVVDDAGLEDACAPACAPGRCGAVGRTTDACPWSCAAECMTRDCWGSRFREATEIGCSHREPVVVVHESVAEHMNPPRHGALHVLSECTGLWEHRHQSDAIWAEGGVLDRAGGTPVR